MPYIDWADFDRKVADVKRESMGLDVPRVWVIDEISKGRGWHIDLDRFNDQHLADQLRKQLRSRACQMVEMLEWWILLRIARTEGLFDPARLREDEAAPTGEKEYQALTAELEMDYGVEWRVHDRGPGDYSSGEYPGFGGDVRLAGARKELAKVKAWLLCSGHNIGGG